MTADDLVSKVTNRGAFPPTQNVWTPALVTDACTEEMWSHVVPLLMATNQDYFTDFQDSAIVGGQSAYELPTRAAGAGLRAAKYLDVNGNEGPPLAMIEVPDIGRYNITTANAPLAVYWTASEINILPTPSVGTQGSIRMYYTRRPGSLVQDTTDSVGNHTAVAVVAGLSFSAGVGTTVTVSLPHSGFMANAMVDFTSFRSPFKLRAKDIACGPATPGGTTFNVPTDITSLGIQVGDFVTASLTSWVPQGIPVEWHSLLELRVVARVQDSFGDVDGSKSVLIKAAEMTNALLALSEPRSSGNPKKMNSWR